MTLKCGTCNTRRRRNFETNMIIWLMNDEIQEKIQLRKIINFHETFNNVDECIDYITECKTENIFFVIIEEFISITLSVIHDLPQIYSIYILSENGNQQIESYSKLRGIYPQIIDIHQEIIQNTIKLVPDNNLSISVLLSNRLSASFMSFQLFLDILLHMDVGHFQKLIVLQYGRGGKEATTQYISRITDVLEEPRSFPPLISGYEKVPLVSLEEAVQPLVDLVSDVQRHAFIAKEYCKNPADGLTLDESASIMFSTMEWSPEHQCLYHVLDATLRSNNSRKLKPWFRYLRLLMSGLSRLPPLRETVYRCINSNLSDQYSIGQTIIWHAFASCTTKLDVLDTFLGTSNRRTMFIIKCVSGRDISQHSQFREEHAVLPLSDTELQVIGCLNQGDLRIIELKEIRPPSLL